MEGSRYWTRKVVPVWTTLWQTYPYRQDDGREVIDSTRLPAQARLVHRGGSYRSNQDELRCTARSNAMPEGRIGWRGFRVAMEV